MDSQIKSLATSDTLTTMIPNNSFSEVGQTAGNSSQDENPVFEFHDVINYLLNAVPFLIAEVCKNEPPRSTVGETTGTDSSKAFPETVITDSHTPTHSSVPDYPVDIKSGPPSLPITSIADRYTRSMLKCLAGYPLYEPQPFNSGLSTEYLRHGVNVGDVGFVREDGAFDFLFNVCPSKNSLINPPMLPTGFSLELPEHSVTRASRVFPRKTHLFQSPISRMSSGEYICEGSEGAILELPEGAIQEDAMNIDPFEKLAARYGVEWYKYAINQGRAISNGSLYLITSVTKCSQWGIAVFDKPCAPGQGLWFDRESSSLRFGKSTLKYCWNFWQARVPRMAFNTKVANHIQADAPNQCVFLRGYKIMIRQDIFDNLCNDELCGFDVPVAGHSSQELSLEALAGSCSPTRQQDHPIEGASKWADSMSKGLSGGSILASMMTVAKELKEVVLHANFNSLVHPSDIINTTLLNQNPNAKVALVHDDIWCNLLQDTFPKLDYATLTNIARSYTRTDDEHDWVSLKHTSDLNKGLDANRPLRETETSALLQDDSRAASNKDYTSVPAGISASFPRELVERILLMLDAGTVLRCRHVNREFNETIQSSVLLQYSLACKAAGVIDNPQSPLSYAERFKLLERREDAWRKLKPVFEATIKVNQKSPSFYDLTAGNYLVRHYNQKDMLYCHLPSSPDDNLEWIRIPGHGAAQNWSGVVVETDMALYEHDLIVNVVCSEVGNQADLQRHSLDLVLLKFSTGEYHPLARHPKIHVQRLPVLPRVDIHVVGDNIAFVVNVNGGPSKLFIFDWKTGHRRLQHEAMENAYLCLVFVSPELLLVPNIIRSHFEVWHLPSRAAPNQIISLKIPAISESYTLRNISCNGEPNPFLHSVRYVPRPPFFPSSEDSIITINLSFTSFLATRDPLSYTIVIRRCELLGMIQKWTSPSLLGQQEDFQTWLTNKAVVRNIVDPDDGSVRLDAQSECVFMMPHPYSSPTTWTFSSIPSCSSSDHGSSAISQGLPFVSTSQYDFLQVQWLDWGPPISRWFEATESLEWIMSSSGQRSAFMSPTKRNREKSVIRVVDFNPHNFRRNVQMRMEGDGEDNNGNVDNEERKGEQEFEMLDHGDVFVEDVYMGLKCVVYLVPGEYDFDGLLMDEERLLGLKHDYNNVIESVEVLYFG